MKSHLVYLTALSIVALSLPGCPGSASALVGNWVVTADFLANTFGMQLNADGTANSFTAPIQLLGNFTWEVDESEFILRQEHSGEWRSFIACVTNESSLAAGHIIWQG